MPIQTTNQVTFAHFKDQSRRIDDFGKTQDDIYAQLQVLEDKLAQKEVEISKKMVTRIEALEDKLV